MKMDNPQLRKAGLAVLLLVAVGVALYFFIFKSKHLHHSQKEYTSREDVLLEYDTETGEPRCENCHSGDKLPSIDYTKSQQCMGCHREEYSERFLSIDGRFGRGERSSPERLPGAPADTTGMVLVEAGEFTMGTNEWWPKSSPAHKMTLPAFYIDIFEVTNAQYQKFVEDTDHNLPDHWKANNNEIPHGRNNHPVTFVDWFDATAYCKWLGKRLPTEFEWEKAARGPNSYTFPWGNEFDKNKANTPQYGHGDTLPVGSFKDGVSPYGAHDMAGNVFEWTDSWYKGYPGNKHPDPNEGERYRVVRGGSYYDCTYYRCGISAPTFNRIFFNPYTRNHNFGFRCVADAPAEAQEKSE